jgi:hypothetical protein
MNQYRITFENKAGKVCIAITCADNKHEALAQVRDSISDYGCHITVEVQDIRSVIHLAVITL